MPSHFWLTKGAVPLTALDIASLTEQEAWETFIELHWGSDGTQKCSWCGDVNQHYFIRTRKQWHCKCCKRRFSVTTGTMFENRKLPFRDLLFGWFSFIAAQKGFPATELRRHIGHTYKTCFAYLGRLREALAKTVDATPMSGLIHIDGGHFSGRPRKGRKRRKPKPAEEEIQIPTRFATNEARQHRAKAGNRANHYHKNRRIVIVIREMYEEPGKGARRTIVAVCRRESAPEIEALVRKHVAPGSMIYSDEWHAYSNLKLMGYGHEAVNHNEEFSRDDGVNENQAESYFSRLRRAVKGIYNRITPHYMLDYATEMAWREDARRINTKEQLFDFAKRVFGAGVSTDWLNYNAGHHRTKEHFFVAPRKKKVINQDQSSASKQEH